MTNRPALAPNSFPSRGGAGAEEDDDEAHEGGGGGHLGGPTSQEHPASRPLLVPPPQPVFDSDGIPVRKGEQVATVEFVTLECVAGSCVPGLYWVQVVKRLQPPAHVRKEQDRKRERESK